MCKIYVNEKYFCINNYKERFLYVMDVLSLALLNLGSFKKKYLIANSILNHYFYPASLHPVQTCQNLTLKYGKLGDFFFPQGKTQFLLFK